MPFITFQHFVQQHFSACKTEYATFLSHFPSIEKYKADYLASHGFNDYFEAIKDTKLTENQTYSIVTVYLKEGRRKLSDLPAIFGSLERYYNISLPVIEGIATPDYWHNRMSLK